MTSGVVSGTEGYAAEANALLRQYEAIPFADVHRQVLHLLPTVASDVVDIGAGTGRDAAALAAMGHRVVAVEPTEPLRRHAMSLHASAGIRWIDDSLPELAALRSLGERFDMVMLTAVWMHLDGSQRRVAMSRVGGLVRSAGLVILSLRHGPVPPGRRMFDVSAEETIGLADGEGLDCLMNVPGPSVQARHPDVTWTRLAFRKA